MDFSQAVSGLLCEIRNELKQIREMTAYKHAVENTPIWFPIPEDATPSAGYRTFSVGTTKIDYYNGVITNPDGSIEKMKRNLKMYEKDYLHSFSMRSTQGVAFQTDGSLTFQFDAGDDKNVPWLTYRELWITVDVESSVKIFACTNYQAVIGTFQQAVNTTVLQTSVEGDTTEAQTYDAVTTLVNNLNRLRYVISAIVGETNWDDTPNTDLATAATHIAATEAHGSSGNILGATTAAATYAPIAKGVTNGDTHDHSGGDGAQINHTTLSNIGTNTHAQVDTAIGTTLPGLVTTHAALTTGTHGVGGSTVASVANITTHAGLTATHGVSGAIVGTTDTQTLSGKTVQLTILPADHSYSGEIINDTVGENVALFDVLYLKSDGKWWRADADASTSMPGAALALAAISADAAGNMLLRGIARDDTWNWTVGGYIYVSTTPGNPTQTAPSGTGDQVQILGFAKTADVVFFNPSYNVVELV